VTTLQTVLIVKEGVTVGTSLVDNRAAPMVNPHSDNQITAECRETGQAVELQLTVNGQLAATARDDTGTFSGTNLGINAVTWTSANPEMVDARFTSFKVDRLS
jgi:hypothetical protein